MHTLLKGTKERKHAAAHAERLVAKVKEHERAFKRTYAAAFE
jgi:hypothetical protein